MAEQNTEYDLKKALAEDRAVSNLKANNIRTVFGSGAGRFAIFSVIGGFIFLMGLGLYTMFSKPKPVAAQANASGAMLGTSSARGDPEAASSQEAQDRRIQNGREATAAAAAGRSYIPPPVLLDATQQPTNTTDGLAPATPPVAASVPAASSVQAAGTTMVTIPVNYMAIATDVRSNTEQMMNRVRGAQDPKANQDRRATFNTGYYPVPVAAVEQTAATGLATAQPMRLVNGVPVAATSAAQDTKQVVPGLSAGTTFYCKISYGVNSDIVRRDAIAHCYNGAANDATFFGIATPSAEGVSDPGYTVVFNSLAIPGHKQLKVDAVGISNDTMEESVVDTVNEHNFPKYSMLTLAGLLQGIGKATTNYASSLTTSVGNVSTTAIGVQKPSVTEIVGGALGGVGTSVGDSVQKKADAMKTTLKIHPGKDIGVVLLQDVTE